MSSNFLLALLCYFLCLDVSVLAFRLKHSAQAAAKGPFGPRPVQKPALQMVMPGVMPVQMQAPHMVMPVQMPVQMPVHQAACAACINPQNDGTCISNAKFGGKCTNPSGLHWCIDHTGATQVLSCQAFNPMVRPQPPSTNLMPQSLVPQNLMPQHRVPQQVPQPKPKPKQPTTDIRGNDIQATIGETRWAVRVLKAAGHPNRYLTESWPGHWSPGTQSNMDLMWEWIQAMQDNGKNGYIPFKLSPPMDEEARLRNHYPSAFVGALHTGHNFKNGVDEFGEQTLGMDFYIIDRFEGHDNVLCIMPDGRSMSLEARHELVRAEPMFELRGRIGVDELPDHSYHKHLVLSRQQSAQNFDAGITMQEFMPEEARHFFHVPVVHGGKNYNVRTRDQYNSSAHFAKIGAPFIAGPSGSIEYLILSMEDNCAGACKDGLIPYQKHKIREALIGLMTAALVAGGHHSITECLAVAQAMGYFQSIPAVLEDYAAGVSGFESYLSQLGIKTAVVGSRQSGENRGDENQQRGGHQKFVPSNLASLDMEKAVEINTDKREDPHSMV